MSLRQLERDLNRFFHGRAPRRSAPARPAKKWGFRYGGDGTPPHLAPMYGPFDTRAAAQTAAESAPVDDQGRYGWAAESLDPALDLDLLDPAELRATG